MHSTQRGSLREWRHEILQVNFPARGQNRALLLWFYWEWINWPQSIIFSLRMKLTKNYIKTFISLSHIFLNVFSRGQNPSTHVTTMWALHRPGPGLHHHSLLPGGHHHPHWWPWLAHMRRPGHTMHHHVGRRPTWTHRPRRPDRHRAWAFVRQSQIG